jgi:hypothetical protein
MKLNKELPLWEKFSKRRTNCISGRKKKLFGKHCK